MQELSAISGTRKFAIVGIVVAAIHVLEPCAAAEGAAQSKATAASIASEVVELLLTGALRSELELVPDQVDQLRDLGAERQEKIAALFRQIKGTTAERRAKIASLPDDHEKVNAWLEKEISAILLPHQQRRWRQIRAQAIYRYDLISALANEAVTSEIGITADERDTLMKRLVAISADYEVQLAELKRKMDEKIAEELSPPQRAKLKELFGEPFLPPKGK